MQIIISIYFTRMCSHPLSCDSPVFLLFLVQLLICNQGTWHVIIHVVVICQLHILIWGFNLVFRLLKDASLLKEFSIIGLSIRVCTGVVLQELLPTQVHLVNDSDYHFSNINHGFSSHIIVNSCNSFHLLIYLISKEFPFFLLLLDFLGFFR